MNADVEEMLVALMMLCGPPRWYGVTQAALVEVRRVLAARARRRERILDED